MMTALLERAVAELRELPPAQQDMMAASILEEVEDIKDEARWEHAFAQSADALTRLADKVRADKAAGRVRLLGFDDL